MNQARVMGMPLYRALPPTGYFLTADPWMNSTALVDRLNFAYQLSGGKIPNQSFDGSHLLALRLLDAPRLPVEGAGRLPVEETRPRSGSGLLHTTAAASGDLRAPVEPELLVNTGTQFVTQLLGQVVTGSRFHRRRAG